MENRTYAETISIEKEYVERLNALLEIKNLDVLEKCDPDEEKNKAEKLNAKFDDYLPLFEVKFENGYSLVADVSSNEEQYFDNYFLYDNKGHEIEFYGTGKITEKMTFTHENTTYMININPVEEGEVEND